MRVVILLVCMLTLTACQLFQTRDGLNSEQIAVLQKYGFQLSDEGWEFGLAAKVLFQFDSDEIAADSQQTIANITQDFLDVGISGLTLEGHTDTFGDPAYNIILSERRAMAVAEVMISSGMSRENIQVRGMGGSKPIADNSTLNGRSENRRVTIIVAN
ncbi:OmpA family protein [Nitrincola sp. A-D6]|uniref:OmpA family protein n=1 Tax=Nitrincola sp. A-D6 TaxID=1545442 RepID=UPI00068EA1B3|nr:OmpA family protein [Nitrincola sp. A-D6]